MMSENKLKHSIVVARMCQKLAKEKYSLSDDYSKSCWVMGYLHDIGYEFIDESELFNHSFASGKAVSGAFCMFENSEFLNAIIMHDKYKEMPSYALLIMWEADLRVNKEGKVVSIKERMEDICKRYDDRDLYHHEIKILENLAMIRRGSADAHDLRDSEGFFWLWTDSAKEVLYSELSYL